MVGQVVEGEEKEESCIGASTPDGMHSTEVAAEHRIEMNGWLVGMILRCEGPRRRRGTGRMSRGGPRRYGGDLVGLVVCLRCPLHPLLVWSRSMRPPLVYVIDLFSDSFGPLVYIFKSRQRKGTYL